MIVDLPAYQLIHLIVCGKKPCGKNVLGKIFHYVLNRKLAPAELVIHFAIRCISLTR